MYMVVGQLTKHNTNTGLSLFICLRSYLSNLGVRLKSLVDWELGSKVLWICKTKPSFSTFTSLKSLLHEQCNRAFQGNSGHILGTLRELTDNTRRTLRENSENSQITLGKHSESIQRTLTSLAKGYLSLFC